MDLSTPSEAERAISELNGKNILERKVSIQLARKPEAPGEGTGSGGEGGSGNETRRRSSGRGRGRGRARGGRTARGGRGVSLRHRCFVDKILTAHSHARKAPTALLRAPKSRQTARQMYSL